MRGVFVSLVLTIIYASTDAWLAAAERFPLRVLYLGREGGDARSTAFVEFLSSNFYRCVSGRRSDFRPDMLDCVDAVLLDWSQQESYSAKYESPLGPLEKWHTPTVLLGSAGLMMAGPWNVIGGAG